MKKVKVQKIYKGYAAVRSYVIEECILNKEKLVITYNKQKMTILVEQLTKHAQLSSQIFHSQFDGKSYKLYDYYFVPDKKKGKS
jgi:carbonic anhydrase